MERLPAIVVYSTEAAKKVLSTNKIPFKKRKKKILYFILLHLEFFLKILYYFSTINVTSYIAQSVKITRNSNQIAKIIMFLSLIHLRFIIYCCCCCYC